MFLPPLSPIQQIALVGLLKNTADSANHAAAGTQDAAATLRRIEESLRRIEERGGASAETEAIRRRVTESLYRNNLAPVPAQQPRDDDFVARQRRLEQYSRKEGFWEVPFSLREPVSLTEKFAMAGARSPRVTDNDAQAQPSRGNGFNASQIVLWAIGLLFIAGVIGLLLSSL